MKSKLVLYTISLMLLACTSHEGPASLPECPDVPEVSYSKDIQAIFSANCISSGCHSGDVPAGNLNLESANSYSQLSNTQSGYINTKDPSKSVLYAQMNSSSNPMPPSGKLGACDLKLVYQWMAQGAKNN